MSLTTSTMSERVGPVNLSSPLVFHLANESETVQLGRWLAAQVRPGNLLLLQGTLGAGKSVLARSIVRSVVREPQLEVPSPTFLLVLPYEGQGRQVLHVDLYRLEDARELEELGLDDDEEAIVLIEWPERAPHLFEQADLVIRIDLDAGATGRTFSLSAPPGSALLDRLQASPFSPAP